MKSPAISIEIPVLQDALTAIDTTDTISAAGRKIVLSELIQLRRHEDAVQSGDDHEAIHDMRVATRRMRSALRLLGAYYRPKEVKRLSRGLKELADELGTVRDLDVLLIDLRERTDFTLAEVMERLEKDRAEAHDALTDALDGRGYKAFLGKLAAFATAPDALRDVEPPAPVQVRHVVASTRCSARTLRPITRRCTNCGLRSSACATPPTSSARCWARQSSRSSAT